MKPRVIITGASSGVGLSIAKHLVNLYHPICISRRTHLVDRALASNCSEYSNYSCDLSCKYEIENILKIILDEHGDVFYLINNAACLTRQNTMDISIENLQYAFYLNCLAPILFMRSLLPAMTRQKFGRIINITSGAPLNCTAGYGIYSSTKAYLNTTTITASKEHMEGNIRINLMSPGPVKTEMSPEATLLPDICLPTLNYLLDDNENIPTGIFAWLGYRVPLVPELSGVDWLAGTQDSCLEALSHD